MVFSRIFLHTFTVQINKYSGSTEYKVYLSPLMVSLTRYYYCTMRIGTINGYNTLGTKCDRVKEKKYY